MNLIKLSVITTVYNGEKYLFDSLDSLLEQTYKDFELVIVNDGSTDDTENIINSYLNKFSNKIFINAKKNEGVPISRNKALAAASGEYIAIHDADDISLPKRFETQIKTLEKDKNIIFGGSHALKINEDNKLIGTMCYPPQNNNSAYKLIYKLLNPIIDPSSFFHKEIILNMGGYSIDPYMQTVQDLELWCRLLEKEHKMYNIQKPLIKYRVNPIGVTRTRQKEMINATCVLKRRLLNKQSNKLCKPGIV